MSLKTVLISFLFMCIVTKSSNALELTKLSRLENGSLLNDVSFNNSISKYVCELCPSQEYVDPCKCFCTFNHDVNVVTLYCTLGLQDQDVLHNILQHSSFMNNNVYKLIVTGTTITGAISEELFHPISITEIEFVNNNIDYIDRHAFRSSANSLIHLDLSYNAICFFSWETLEENQHLRSLTLDHNRLTVIATQAFPSTSLINITMSYNQISYLGSEAFSKLMNVQYINLAHNDLTSLDDYVLKFHQNKTTTYRITIDLSYNKISNFKSEAFNGIKPSNLDLRYNLLTNLDETIFGKLFNDLFGNMKVKVNGNPLECDCSFNWIMNNFSTKNMFDDFLCPKQNKTFGTMIASDLGQCR